MSYRKRHIKSKIHRIKPKKSILKKLWFWIAILIIIVLLTIVYFLFFYSKFEVKNILISGNEKISTEELQKIIFENSNTGLVNFGIIKIFSKSIFLVNKNSLKQKILKEFPVIEKLTVDKNLPQTIKLGVVERKPVGIYCSKSESEEECFLIDNNGVAFEVYLFDASGFFIVRQMFDSFSDREIFTGKEVIQKNMIEAIILIEKELKDNLNIEMKEAFLTSPTRLNVKTGGEWDIYFNLESDIDINLQITQLRALFKGGVFQAGDGMDALKYIDLRIKDRAIICDNNNCSD